MAQNPRNTDRELGKVFNDSIHGHVELHPLLVKIIDTPQFQRLRNIKQLGGGYLVYPGASHNRFEHSIGVAHLAGVLAKTIRKNQPELNITDEDILCLQIAGLCHDLGHGPFSHLFDQMFMPQACKNEEWKHETASLEMFEHLVEVNNLKPEMEKYGLNDDQVFIKELILGEPLDDKSYKGREEEKSFLYDIVSNKQNGIDVDKFDYFARDCHHLGIKNNFDHLRYFKFVRVVEVKTDQSKRKHIGSRDKEVWNLYNMFHARNLIYRRVCQHRVTSNVQIMIKDALLKANSHIKIKGKEGKMFTLSDAKNDMEAYTKLTDQVTEKIMDSTGNDLNQAREILQRIMTRKLYMLVGEAKVRRLGKTIPKETVGSLRQELGLTNTDFENIQNGYLEVVVRQTIPEGEQTQDKKIPKETIDSLKHQLKDNLTLEEREDIRDGLLEVVVRKTQVNKKKKIEEKAESLKQQLKQVMSGVEPEDLNDYFEVVPITYSYGKEDKDPIKYTYFYKKNEPQEGFTIPRNKVSNFLPECFMEQSIRVYWKKEKENRLDAVTGKFKNWCDINKYEVDIYIPSDNKQPPEDANPSV